MENTIEEVTKTEKRALELEFLIKKHKELYYQGTPEIHDHEFDELEEELKKIKPDSYVLNLVGSSLGGSSKIKHDQKMLSLDKCYEEEDLIKWIDNKDVLSIYKLDGMSCSLIYEDGKLVMAKTRGNGSEGEFILDKALWIDDIPKILPPALKETASLITHGLGPDLDGLGRRVEVRGELYCKEENFIYLSQAMLDRNLEKPTSQRNIVAGLVSRKDNIDLCHYLSFLAFDITNTHFTPTRKLEEEKFTNLKKLNFSVPDYQKHKGSEGVTKRIQMAQEFMSYGDYQIDGLVFVFNELKIHDELGETAHHPRYKMAFKFKGASKETYIEEIEWGVSRNGILTPVAKVKPVELSGAIITNVTLHNFGLVKQFQLKKGDKIEIIRSGEVIPKFLSVTQESKNSLFEYPSVCPSCNSNTEIEDIRLICPNQKCEERVIASILNYIDKVTIEDLSDKRLKEMLKAGLIKDIPDLYKLKINDLLKLDKVKEKLATKLIKSIEKSKNVTLPVFLSALGLSGGALNKCEKVVNFGFNSIEKLKRLTIEDLVNIDSFAEKSATEFVNSLKLKMPLIDELLGAGVNIIENSEKKSDLLLGQSFCITGELSKPRKVIESLIKESGGQVLSSVTKNLSFLVTNEKDSTSSKFVKAKNLGIKIISENDLEKMLEK